MFSLPQSSCFLVKIFHFCYDCYYYIYFEIITFVSFTFFIYDIYNDFYIIISKTCSSEFFFFNGGFLCLQITDEIVRKYYSNNKV